MLCAAQVAHDRAGMERFARQAGPTEEPGRRAQPTDVPRLTMEDMAAVQERDRKHELREPVKDELDVQQARRRARGVDALKDVAAVAVLLDLRS